MAHKETKLNQQWQINTRAFALMLLLTGARSAIVSKRIIACPFHFPLPFPLLL